MDYCAVNLLPIIYSYDLPSVQCFLFGLLCVVVVALSVCPVLCPYTHIFTYLIEGEKPKAWTVAGSGSLDQKTLSLPYLLIDIFFGSLLLNILHI